MKPAYYLLDTLINEIDEPNRMPAWRIWRENGVRFVHTPGSSHNHQAWAGGYLWHITEVMNIAKLLYPALDAARPHPFSSSDALLALYLHDIEKPWKYSYDANWNLIVNPEITKERHQEFREQKIREYGFVLTPDHWNAIEYAEGEHRNYSPRERRQKPLAAFVHMCDTWSARGWFDFPKAWNEGDAWSDCLVTQTKAADEKRRLYSWR